MKLVNHHKSNYTFVDAVDSSVMNGTIYMTEDEWKDSIAYLRQVYGRAKQMCTTYTRDALAHVFEWTLKTHKDAKRICLGVEATRLIAGRNMLKRYKKQNYVIEIV